MSEKTFRIKRQDEHADMFVSRTRAWIGEGVIVYTSLGSSTNPPTIEKAEQIGNTIYLTTRDTSGIGTADLRPILQFIEYSDSTPIPKYTKIILDGVQQN